MKKGYISLIVLVLIFSMFKDVFAESKANADKWVVTLKPTDLTIQTGVGGTTGSAITGETTGGATTGETTGGATTGETTGDATTEGTTGGATTGGT
ncbi:hypothetical protein, partial [Bacillus sp. AFS088145]|uniref:hypothetical protein n=1 Tax=Bacillus sp. AFS088145 TaxID=2033514 RepID=UPI0015CF796D